MEERKNNKSILWVVILIVAVIIIISVVFIVIHNRSSNSSTLTQAQTNSAKQQIENNWKLFFANTTSLQERENLLQNGTKFAQPIQSEFSSLGSATTSVNVKSIELVNSSNANVVYNVNLNGQTVLTNQKGYAILVNNNWKISDSTLCGLLSMAGSKPSECQNN